MRIVIATQHLSGDADRRATRWPLVTANALRYRGIDDLAPYISIVLLRVQGLISVRCRFNDPIECRVVCESPTHLEARYTIDGHLYRLVGLHSGSTVRTTLDEVRETSTNFTMKEENLQ